MKNRIIAIVLVFFALVNTVLIVCSFNITPLTIKRDTFIYEYGSEISTAPQDYINANETILSQVVLNFSQLKNEVGKYKVSACILYTSDAAVERISVDYRYLRMMTKKQMQRWGSAG